MPGFIADKIREAEALFAKYPPIRGSDELRASIADWIGRRFGLAGVVDPAREILPCNGSREGLFYAAFPAVGRKPSVEAAGDPDVQSLLSGLSRRGARRPGPSPSSSMRRRKPATFPISTQVASDEALLADGGLLSLLAGQPSRRRRKRGLHPPRARSRPRLRLHAVFRRMLFGALLRRGSHRRARSCSQNSGTVPQSCCLQLAVEALEPAWTPLRLLGRRRLLPRYAVRGAQPRRPPDAGADPACLGGRVGRGAARHGEPPRLPGEVRRSRRGVAGHESRLQAAPRPAASSSGST